MEQQALAKLVELFTRNLLISEQLMWINEKYDLRQDLPLNLGGLVRSVFAGKQIDFRSIMFSMLKAAYKRDSFHLFLGEMLALYASCEAKAKKTAEEIERRRILEGDADWNQGAKAARILGCEWTAGKGLFDEDTIVVLPTSGELARQAETSKLRILLEKRHLGALTSLRGAYEAYSRGGLDGRRQACEACRNSLENLVGDVSGKPLGPGIAALSADSKSRRELLDQLRDFLAGRGPHASEQPSDDDTLLAIRLTEDVMIWMLQQSDQW